jgi:hypothetical protein
MAITSRNLGREEAEAVAARALGFLASDADRLGRFLALSGLDPTSIRQASRGPGFLPAVIDHLLGDEALLLAFCDAEGLRPETIATAHQALSGRGGVEEA